MRRSTHSGRSGRGQSSRGRPTPAQQAAAAWRNRTFSRTTDDHEDIPRASRGRGRGREAERERRPSGQEYTEPITRRQAQAYADVAYEDLPPQMRRHREMDVVPLSPGRPSSPEDDERAQAFIEEHTDFLSHRDTSRPANDECPVCLEGIEEHVCVKIVGIPGCNHLIGLECLETLLKERPDDRKACPLCRAEWVPENGVWVGPPSSGSGGSGRERGMASGWADEAEFDFEDDGFVAPPFGRGGGYGSTMGQFRRNRSPGGRTSRFSGGGYPDSSGQSNSMFSEPRPFAQSYSRTTYGSPPSPDYIMYESYGPSRGGEYDRRGFGRGYNRGYDRGYDYDDDDDLADMFAGSMNLGGRGSGARRGDYNDPHARDYGYY